MQSLKVNRFINRRIIYQASGFLQVFANGKIFRGFGNLTLALEKIDIAFSRKTLRSLLISCPGGYPPDIVTD